MDPSSFGLIPVACSCEHGNEPSGFIEGGKFLDQLCNCLLLKENSDFSELVLCL
jgi:hypothetical protein